MPIHTAGNTRCGIFLKKQENKAMTATKKKTLAQCSRTSGDMRWLQRLLSDLGLNRWLENERAAGNTARHIRTRLLETENGQLELRVQMELLPANTKGTDE